MSEWDNTREYELYEVTAKADYLTKPVARFMSDFVWQLSLPLEQWDALGRPLRIRITIEGVDDDE